MLGGIIIYELIKKTTTIVDSKESYTARAQHDDPFPTPTTYCCGRPHFSWAVDELNKPEYNPHFFGHNFGVPERFKNRKPKAVLASR